MDIGSSFSYVFQDPQWLKKVGIGGAILFGGVLFSWLLALPLLAAGILLLGYTLTVTKNVAEGSSVPLPEWTDFGALFMKGLYGAIGSLILYIPVIVLACCSSIVQAGAQQAFNGSSSSNSQQILSMIGLLATCLGCLQSLLGLVTGVFLYAPLTRFALNNQLSVFWDFKGNFAFIQQNVGSYIIAVLLAWVASIIGGFGVILCVIPVFWTAFWANLVGSHLFGQYARQAASASPMMMTQPPSAPTPTAM